MSAYRKIIQLLTGCRWGRTKWDTFTAWAARPTTAVSRFFVNNSRASLFPFSNYLVYTLSSVFVWNREGIDDNDFDQTIRQFWKMYREQLANGGNGNHKLNGKNGNGNNGGLNGDDDEWEEVIIKEHFQVYRKLLSKDSYLYQYKIFGTFKDIPAKAFFLVQLDTAFRKAWDRLVVKLDIVDSEGNHIHSSQGNDVDYEDILDDCIQSRESFDSKNQVVHWIMHYPYPMYCREYCYVRRAKIDRENNLMILVSRSTDHPNCNDNGTINGKQKYVRVNTYDSRMVIRPHSTFDENGFDYLLTYFDDPQSNFPSAAYNWMACSGVPDFVNKLHDAAVKLNQRSQERRKEKELRTYRRQEEEELTRIQEEERQERERRQKEQQEREEKEDQLARQHRIWQEQERLRKWRMREKSFAQLGSGHLVIRDNRKYGHHEDRNEFVEDGKTATMTPLNKEKTEIENVDRVPHHHPPHPTEEEPSSATITQSTSSSSSSQNNSPSSTMVSSMLTSPSQNKTTTSPSTSAQTAPSSSPSTGTTLYQF